MKFTQLGKSLQSKVNKQNLPHISSSFNVGLFRCERTAFCQNYCTESACLLFMSHTPFRLNVVYTVYILVFMQIKLEVHQWTEGSVLAQKLKGTVSRDGIFFIATLCVYADGFQGLSKTFHYPINY
jgi:hypothetical protein